MSPSTTPAPVAILDTNSVHYVRLYLALALEHKMWPYGGSTVGIDSQLVTIFRDSKRALESYKKGFKLSTELLERTSNGWQIQYSRFTRLELTSGALKAKAIEDAIREKMPSRWWNRLDENELLARLMLVTYEEVEREVGEIDTLLDSAGISVTEFDIHRFPEVFEMAKLLLGLVFLEEGDCIVYAGALVEEADEVWTSDGYLKKIISWIENPGAAPPDKQTYFGEVRRRVIEGLAKVISIDPSEVQLPKAH